MLPKLNRRRALFVLTKIDEILAWERQKEAERDTRFVELGRYLCEVRAGQYWRLENLKSFDEFLDRRFPESRRKAYYLMSIHEHLHSASSSSVMAKAQSGEGPNLNHLVRHLHSLPRAGVNWKSELQNLGSVAFAPEEGSISSSPWISDTNTFRSL